ncbi:MAG: precorrin-2 dehydrogenase [Candidatus Methanofastidiosum methylothiophilum]|uniref:precorrin-2 dehydrogenase n=1 Tax=Candidatus Methanofastidiosum methylothiophilum TaxID=1705564 RepID=A0A150J035_9EURY|nr:MAG: precorrin-2 dehydrogenase [Candidatus Methanofastidiosum methylthiophilus]KYC47727.1 MAG: precorrin-2 dehydrogenase [Candidatus Methanofastidiosum methylthiophilus]KYC50498.1 MAG: precorrin-2 dehydrogenase [Candidatus Methanofastidiosum methylthiophilus]
MYFPIILNTNKEVLIIGAGNVSLRKTKKLLEFTDKIRVVSTEFHKDFDNLNIKKIEMEVNEENFSDLITEETSFVILSLNNKELNKKLAIICKNNKLLVNVVDDKDLSDIIFPAVIERDNLLVAISTKGECPFYSKKLKDELTEFIDRKQKEAKILIDARKKGDILEDTYEKIKRGF